ncbi:MAG: metallophosphoesterase [Nitrososphaeria archaeon]
MASGNISILYEDAALIIKTKKDDFLCVADLHLGYSPPTPSVLLPDRRACMSLASKITDISRKTKVENLILLGDLKHTIARATYSDHLLVNHFFDKLSSSFRKIHLVLGNHDGSITNILPSHVVPIKRGELLGQIYLMHGHTLPSYEVLKSNLIVMGHLHPVFYKEHSPLNGQRVWILMTLSLKNLFPKKKALYNLIIMPSFNPETSYSLKLSYSLGFTSLTSPLLNRCKKEIIKIKTVSLEGAILS